MATFNLTANFSVIENAGVYSDAIHPATVIDAATDYHWLSILNPYGVTNSQYAQIHGLNSGSGSYKTIDGGSSWSAISGYTLGQRLYIDGTKQIYQDSVGVYITEVGRVANNRGIANVISTGAVSGALTRIDYYVGGFVGGVDIVVHGVALVIGAFHRVGRRALFGKMDHRLRLYFPEQAENPVVMGGEVDVPELDFFSGDLFPGIDTPGNGLNRRQ